MSRPVVERCLRFAGLSAFFEQSLDNIALMLHHRRFSLEAWLLTLRRTAGHMDQRLQLDGIEAAQLTRESHEMLGWFRYFSAPAPLREYADAVRRAQSVFERHRPNPSWRPPLLVHFRPSGNLYRWRVLAHGTRVVLPTPMIRFDQQLLTCLAAQMAGGRRGAPAVSAAMLAEPCQSLVREIEAAAGFVERAAGRHHDLAASFERVNRDYFAAAMPRPTLAWSRKLTARKFGHYDFVADTVMVSSSLDRADVPAFVVDHVMHHELLHKKHGMLWRRGRRRTHTPAFRREERQFRQYHAADEFLRNIATRLRR